MKCISRHLKRLHEEKLLAKEDDGGAPAPGGDGGVIAPADGGAPAPGDVMPPDAKPDVTGLSTTDVFGKCDHRKDGVFGPGCFHLPCIWSIPYYRLPGKKKKRRKPKYHNVVSEEDQFDLFEKDAKFAIQREMDEAQKWLDGIDPEISLEYSEDYDFDGEKSDWVAALDKEGRDDVKTFPVAFNLKALYDFLYEQGLEMDELELALQIRVSLWHEIGHALLDYFRDMDIFDFEVSGIDEEKLVEEFAKHRIKKYSGVHKSRLNDFVNEIFSKTRTDEDEGVLETKGDVETDFKQPIRLSNRKRFVPAADERLKSTSSKSFVVSDIQVPGETGLFAEQNGKDLVAALNRNGLLRLQVEIVPEDQDEADFMRLPEDDRRRFVDIIRNIERYLEDPKDDFELETASEFETAPEEERLALANRYEALSAGTKSLWYRPTLLDVIRICHAGGVESLPLEFLIRLDNDDHDRQKRYIESGNVLDESIMDHDFTDDMYMLQAQKSHFAPERWSLLRKDFGKDVDLGYLYYTVRLAKNNAVGTNYIFSSGVLFGYDEDDKKLVTAYYIEPSEVIYMLRDGEILQGDRTNVSMRLLWRCFMNLVEKKAFAGHWERRQAYG